MFVKEYFEKFIVEKISKQQQKHEKLPSMQRVNLHLSNKKYEPAHEIKILIANAQAPVSLRCLDSKKRDLDEGSSQTLGL